MVKNPPAMPGTWVRSLLWEDPPEEGMATHSSVLAWRILWTEEPGRLHSAGVSGSNTTKHSTKAARRGSSHTLRWKRSPAWKKTFLASTQPMKSDGLFVSTTENFLFLSIKIFSFPCYGGDLHVCHHGCVSLILCWFPIKSMYTGEISGCLFDSDQL